MKQRERKRIKQRTCRYVVEYPVDGSYEDQMFFIKRFLKNTRAVLVSVKM